jgi:hypothetical protein
MKIKELRPYQSVKFNGQEQSFFHKTVRGMENLKMYTVEWGILVETEKDQAIVSFNNIAYAKPEERILAKSEERPVNKPPEAVEKALEARALEPKKAEKSVKV